MYAHVVIIAKLTKKILSYMRRFLCRIKKSYDTKKFMPKDKIICEFFGGLEQQQKNRIMGKL